MISAQTYLEHIRRDGTRIAQVARAHLKDEVPSCPGNTVESLLLHVAGVCLFWTGAIRNKAPTPPDFTQLEGDIERAYLRAFESFVDEIAQHDPDEETWVWGYDPHVRFWYRRAAHELSIHRWDFENTVGDALPIDATLAMDGIRELLEEFGPKPENFLDVQGASERFAGDGETIRFEPTDQPGGITITCLPERFEISDEGTADATARGAASDLNLFVWGRVTKDVFDIDGDASLLQRWSDRVKI